MNNPISIDEATELLVEDYQGNLDNDDDADRFAEEYRTELEMEPDRVASEWQKRFGQFAEFVITDDGDNVIVVE